MSIKIGNLDVSYFKVGGDDCSIYLGDIKLYPSTSNNYLRFVSKGSGTFTFTPKTGAASGNVISYSLDSGSTWVSANTTPTVQSGDVVYIKGENMGLSNAGIGTFSSTANFDVEGNVMSLLYGDSFDNEVSLSGKNYAFMNLFSGCTTVINADKMELPATTLSQNCYTNMFNRAVNLASPPSLTAATTLAVGCYFNMFYNQTANTAFTVNESYFLPAETLVQDCYRQMFFNCRNLDKVTSLATSGINTNNSTTNWLGNVAASGTFTKASSASWPTNTNGIPSGWTVQDYNTGKTYTYSVTIQGLENGDTTNITWSSPNDYHEDNNVGNGVYTYTTSSNWIQVNINSVTNYTVDYDNFYLDADDHFSKTVTFTYQGGGGGGLVQIPYGTDMSQYYGQYVKRLVINDTSVSGSGAIFQNWWSDYIYLSSWQISGGGQFSSINSLPIDITLSGQGAQLNYWGYDNTTLNHLNDLQIEWA